MHQYNNWNHFLESLVHILVSPTVGYQPRDLVSHAPIQFNWQLRKVSGLRAGADAFMTRVPARAAPDGAPRRVLVLSVFHGLANRLRTVAAGAALAEALDRDLHVDWRANRQCNATWEELFSAPSLRTASAEIEASRDMSVDARAEQLGWTEYAPRAGCGSALDRFDLAGLADDEARIVRLRCAKCVSSLTESASSAAEDEASRATFYRTIVPSVAVAALMAPVTSAGVGRYVVGVHIRQGDAYDTAQAYFFRDRSGVYGAAADGGALVERFLQKMSEFPPAKGKHGQLPTVFFVASDQLSARRRCAARFPGRVLQLAPALAALAAPAVDGGGAALSSELVRRDTVSAMQEAAAEWLLLSECKRLIRSGVSSFSSEAARCHSIPACNINRESS